jgi:hypothetical protein
VVPQNIKPFLHREITFQTYIDLLADKRDAQRISLNLKQF